MLMTGDQVRTNFLVFVSEKNRRLGKQKHVSEVLRAVSEYRSVHQTKHRDVSAFNVKARLHLRDRVREETVSEKRRFQPA